MVYEHIKRVNENEHFGNYLQVDLFNLKTCTFNCIHCRAGPTINQIPQRVYIYPIEKVYNEIADSIEKDGKINFIKYSHRGDPTLYVLFGSLNKKIKENFPEVKIATCTNCSMIFREDISNELKNVDLVIVGLDTVIEEEFQKINRPIKQVKLLELLDNAIKFNKEYNGKFWVNTIFLKDYNDSQQSILAMKKYLERLQPEKYLAVFETTEKGEHLSQEFKMKLLELYSDVSFDVQIGTDRP